MIKLDAFFKFSPTADCITSVTQNTSNKFIRQYKKHGRILARIMSRLASIKWLSDQIVYLSLIDHHHHPHHHQSMQTAQIPLTLLPSVLIS